MSTLSKPRIFVTGATGKTGGAVVAELLRQGWPVRAVVRRRDERSALLDTRGAETVVADYFDVDQLRRAMEGTRRAYYLPIMDPFMIQGANAFALAAKDAKLEQVVQMSQWLSSPSHPSLLTRQLWLVDRLFADIPGVAHTILNPGMFADNFLRVIDFATLLRVYPHLTKDSRSAPVSDEDIARVAVAVLADPVRHAGRSYRPTGPALLSGDDMGEAIGRAIGKRVMPVGIPLWMFFKTARMQGVDPYEISGFRFYLEDHWRGAFSAGGGVTDVVRELTGAPAENFETTARRYAAKPFAKPTLANRARAIWNFNRTPLHPGWNLDRFDRDHGFPTPSTPRLAIEDEGWKASHLAAGQPAAVRLVQATNAAVAQHG
jgi:NAD(P)H dehydrogenase (quinone)